MRLILFLLISMLMACNPGGFTSSGSKQKTRDKIDPAAIVENVSSNLVGKLTNAYSIGSVVEEIEYCSQNAQLIIDDSFENEKVMISRVSEKFRNPANRPIGKESQILSEYDMV